MASLNSSHVGKVHPIDPEQKAAIEAISNDISSALSQARRSSEETLDAYRAIGDALIKAKPMLSKRYLAWTQEKFGFSKQWCARLTTLAQSWAECEQARTWAREQGCLPGNAYSVDGALALVREWRRVTAPEPQNRADKPKRQKLIDLEAQLEAERAKNAEKDAELAEARARVAFLENELAMLRGGVMANTTAEEGPVNFTSSDLPSVEEESRILSPDGNSFSRIDELLSGERFEAAKGRRPPRKDVPPDEEHSSSGSDEDLIALLDLAFAGESGSTNR